MAALPVPEAPLVTRVIFTSPPVTLTAALLPAVVSEPASRAVPAVLESTGPAPLLITAIFWTSIVPLLTMVGAVPAFVTVLGRSPVVI